MRFIKAFGARASDQPLEFLDITRRAPGAHDVQIDIAYCGVCHSDERHDSLSGHRNRGGQECRLDGESQR